MNHFDKLSKLLATENLSVQRAPVRTASFDPESRTLTLPQWKDMTDSIETMLIGHEVGHALFTTVDMMQKTLDIDIKLKDYVNVVEDVRVERFMKEKFPGLRKDFLAGYKELNDRDFFGVKNMDLSGLSLIDRINLYFKVGIKCGVRFTPEEMAFISRIDRAKTPDEVIALAKEIFDYAKEKYEEKKEQQQQEDAQNGFNDELEGEDFDDEEDFDDDGEFDDSDEDSELDDLNFGDDPMDPTGATRRVRVQELENEEEDEFDRMFSKDAGDQKDEEEFNESATTQKNFDDAMDELADTELKYRYYDLEDVNFIGDMLVNYKTVLKETSDEYISDSFQSQFKTFMSEQQRAVNYLVKEFEMRKSAAAYKRATIAKSGTLDMSKLYAYKLKDDIFRKVKVLPEGKNHGMVFLLDWSGSMQNVIQDTIRQLIPLAMFCRRVHIPFRVFAFSSEYRSRDGVREQVYYTEEYKEAFRSNIDSESQIPHNSHKFKLLEFMNEKMSNTEFNTMVKRLLHRSFQWNGGYSLGGTPLNEALLYLVQYLPKFIRDNNIEKTTLVTLTDGEGNRNIYVQNREYTRDDDQSRQVIKIKNFLRDSKFKKDYLILNSSSHQTQMWLEVLKDRYNVNIVGFHVCEPRNYEIRSALCNNGNLPYEQAIQKVRDVRKDWRTNGFYPISGTVRDEMFLLAAAKLRKTKEEVTEDIDNKMTAAQIARKFSKGLKSDRTARILLDRFVGVIS